MKNLTWLMLLVVALLLVAESASAQVATNSLPGRVLVKLLPDYLRTQVYALNSGNGTNPGTLLALNSTNGAMISEIAVGINPTDMAMTPAGDALYVINTGSRTISKVDLQTFSLVDAKSISTPNSYSPANPLHIAAGRPPLVYFTDGAWGPDITTFDYNSGTSLGTYNDGNGAGGMVVTRNGNTMYTWMQYGWSAGLANSYIRRVDTVTNNLTPLETGPSQWRDPIDTPIFLDAAEQRVFNKVQMVSATNVSVLLGQFSDNIYAISLDGSLAFGPTEVYNTQNGALLTNLAFACTVQSLSGDQTRLFRYQSSPSALFVYDMSTIAPVSGPAVVPTPADGAVVGLPPASLAWTVSPYALAYDVYFGTNQAQVAAATQSSAPYLGRVTSPFEPLSLTLSAGASYYWRVDIVGFSVTNTGPVWSFSISTLAVSPTQISLSAIGGYNPPDALLSLTGVVVQSWTASVKGASWLTLEATNGTSPSTVAIRFGTAGLPPGIYTNQIEVATGGQKVEVPVTVDIKSLNLVKLATDYQRGYLYGLQAPAASGQRGLLLFINTTNNTIDKALPIGTNPTDLTVNYGEGRLYIASWGENATYVIDLNAQMLVTPLRLGTDIYKINSAGPGRIVTEGEDQWIAVNLVDTSSGTNLGAFPFPEREGDGESDPTGTYYYHCDNNISDAHLHKFVMTNNAPVEIAGGLEHPYGTRNLVLSPDGTTLFWNSYLYDANLNELGYFGEEIYATTAHGDLALGGQHVFNAHNGQIIYAWPFSASVMAVSGDQQKVFLFNAVSNQLAVIPMSAIASVPGPGLNPTPPDGSVINPPLSQVSWTTSPFALRYRVYFGTNKAAVASADTNSPLYLGTTSTTTFSPPIAFNPGSIYYWRVDAVGFSSVTTGPAWSFTVSSLSVSPQNLSLSGVVGLPILPQSISLTAPVPGAWSLNIAQPWISASATNGTTPSSVTLNFNTAGLTSGLYTNQLTLTANGIALQVPVVVQLFDLNAAKMATDPNRNYIYVLHPGSGTFADAFLLFLNTDTGIVERVIPIGINPTDLTVNRFEDRLYVSNWLHNQTQVVDLKNQTLLPPLALGTDVYKINAGRFGRIITEGEDQWIAVYIVDTTTGTNVAPLPYPEREGDGETDPTGNFYYHCDNNISDAHIHKYSIANDAPAEVADGPQHAFGTRNLILSPDGTRLFWNTYAYDSNLNELGSFGAEIYACSTNGSIAFSDHQAFSTATKQAIAYLPVTSSVKAVDRTQQRLWYFNGSTHAIESIPMSVIRMPSIIQQPAPVTSVAVGGNLYLSVSAIGLNDLAYRWLLAGTNLVGATNYFLSLNNIQTSQQGSYQVIVSNPYGAVTSAVAQVTVLAPPGITSQPAGINVFAGEPFTLAVTATGSAPLGYQWFFQGTPLADATNALLSVSNAQALNEGAYNVQVANAVGSVTSSVALVRVLPTGPAIVSGPASITVPASSNATFQITVVGTEPLSYQWLFNGKAVLGASSAQYALNDVQSPNAGLYQAIVANSLGAVTSAVATLTVTPAAPYFVVQPVGATLPAGTNFNLTALAQGSEPIAYMWLHDHAEVAGAYQPSLILTNLAIPDSGAYALVASNAVGISTSLVATVVVTAAPPVFVLQPASATVLAGSNVTLTSLAAGSTPLQYQWFFDNAVLPNQTNSQLTLTSVTSKATGAYFAIATNSFGSATSAVAQVTVNYPPGFLQSLTNQIVNAGQTITLAVAGNGTGPLSYSWQWNGFWLSNTAPTLTIPNIRPAQAGYYQITVTNPYGTVSSTCRVSVFGPASRIIAWGDDSEGQSDVPTNLDDVVMVSGGDFHSLALRHDGSLLAWGSDANGQIDIPTNAGRYVAIACGADHNLAMTEDGSVVAWGRNDAGQANVPGSVSSALALAAGESHSIALVGSGTVVVWGDDTYGQTDLPSILKPGGYWIFIGGQWIWVTNNGLPVKAIAAGRDHNLAVLFDGTVVGWGANAFGQASPPPGLSNVVAVAAGDLHSLALLSSGTVVAWGDNAYGQTSVPPGLSNVVAIAAGDFHTLALRADGSVVAWGNNSYGQTNVPETVLDCLGISSGYYHGLALVPATPILHPALTSNGLLIKWSAPGILQWAPTPLGPFQDIPGVRQSYTNTDFSAPARFFRLRLQ